MNAHRLPLRIALGLLCVAALLYLVLFAVIQQIPFRSALTATLANVLTLAMLGLAVRSLVGFFAPRLASLAMVGLHALGAFLFALLWFWLLMVALGVLGGDNAVTFSVSPFTGPAAAWQLKQGLAYYAVFAVLAHWEAALRTLGDQAKTGDTGVPARQFVRDGEETVPLDPDRVFYFSGAGDYSEMHALGGKRLLRTSLSELEDTLGDRFMRVHRSLLVNLEKVERMEPAGGGRLALHMANGDTVTASRSGSKAIRTRTL